MIARGFAKSLKLIAVGTKTLVTAEAGIAPVVLKTWMGHTNIHITLDTYADVFEGMHNDAIKQFDGYLNDKEE